MYEQVFEIDERIRPWKTCESEELKTIDGLNGQKYVVERTIDLAQVRHVLEKIKKEGVITSLAIVLMHAYAYPDHEQQIAKIAEEEFGFSQVSISYNIMNRVKLVKRG